MKVLKLTFAVFLTLCLLGVSNLQAQGPGNGPGGMIVTRHFTGI